MTSKGKLPEVVIYHNVRCSKSRSACEIVAGKGIEARIVEYLKTPPNREELQALLKKLGMTPSGLVRRGESVFKENYAGRTLDEEQWLDALLAHPILIERPIVVCGDRAVIGRPPEKVLELFDA
ncbi:MAG: arsenate reductase (glutaredoxin) [Candidatus Accumulibacter sp.]|jgi:arsenate reductase|nr:arsenate reductase (glutaredoxin) [Accumulibacter sp.]